MGLSRSDAVWSGDEAPGAGFLRGTSSLGACRLNRVGFQNSVTVLDQQVSGRGCVVVDETAADRSTSDPAVDRLGDRRFRAWCDVVAGLGVGAACCGALRTWRAPGEGVAR